MTTRRVVLCALALFSLSLPAGAQMPALALTTAPAGLPAGTYAMDPTHARILFSYEHLGYSTSYGMFTLSTATLHFDPKDPSHSGLDATIDLNGIDTSVARLDEHLKGPDFFDVAQFPQASFHATAVTLTGSTTGTVTGTLTLHGVTKPVTLNIVFNGGAPHPMAKVFTLGFDATGVVSRSAFGLGRFVPLVGDDVTLTISAEFRKAD